MAGGTPRGDVFVEVLDRLSMSMNDAAGATNNIHKPVILVIGAILLGYALATLAGWTTFAAEEAAHEPHAADAPVAHVWAVMPFVMLLGSIAVLPLLEQTSHWWEHNLNKFYVAVNLALLTLMYLAFVHPQGSLGLAAQRLEHVVIQDYIPFIVLLFSLYTISGGIRIEGDLPAHPLTNATFIATCAGLASLIGTTGAAMLLVRPLLETNVERKHVAHTVVFFIFVVCNCGGLLLPLGDPPLFLGYLNGVDFLWTLSLWKHWLLVNGLLLAIYLAVDHFYYYPHETKKDLAADEANVRKLTFSGAWPNAVLLLGIVLSVALLDPTKEFLGTSWHPWMYLREMVQLSLVAISLMLGPHVIREANGFDYVAIIEVGALFIGIFVAMQPALEILNARGAHLGIDSAKEFFWASGWLSSVLDNAPTYLVFFKTAQSLPAEAGPAMAGVSERLLTGVALGSVTMGAMTYIGNGPNFMVKTIAEKSGVPMPSFFGYTVYSFVVLLPILVLDTWLFLE
jgi:Na+/H+ antiporter NhaD/arsenite permease-like protein